ncbi:alpha/beta fold hydrolase [Bdellovibrio svalbardensis]|uniref:Alpha/beta hydrolase n=1 Tax=Bdellovibrio svalbardensis TaxID=2972972 RepID=A0ABT6DL22_9BACT|nr:alpha/beta hydrolase [Bdellovibrio svalbardensis]MDG0817269.1 alpha/beta hydrolase [Bdellovibrio svalbardensis]
MVHFEVIENVVPENVLFVHGNLASNRWWYPAQEVWKKQAEGKNFKGALIFAEFRGCGKSPAPADASEVNMHTFAKDFISLVKKLNRGPVHVVGHSTGGLIAALMLAKEPSLFKKAVLLDPVGAQGVTFDRSMIAAFEQMKVDKNLTAVVIGSTIHNNNAEAEFFKNVIVEDAFHAVKSVGHWVLEALDGLDVREELGAVSHDVLVLHGEHDQLLPKADSEAMAKLFSRGKFQIIEGQGHCANVESPEKFVSITQSFLF